MNRTECLETAKNIVNGDRQENYGNPENNFKNISELWTTYFNMAKNTEDWYDITPTDVANMMILMKMARLMNKPDHEDSWVDIAGYASNGCEIATNRKKLSPLAKTVDEDFFKGWNKIGVDLNLNPVEVEEIK